MLKPVRSVAVLGLIAVLALRVAAAGRDAETPAGQWRVEFATPLGQRAVNMTIEQAGAKLTGHVVDEYGEYELRGHVAGRDVTVAWSVPEHGKMLPITMRGRLDGNLITGTATLGDIGDGALTARRTGS